MERYKLYEFYPTFNLFLQDLVSYSSGIGLMLSSSITTSDVHTLFIAHAIYGEFFDDEVAYYIDDAQDPFRETNDIFMRRLGYDVAVKYPYWKKKYDYVLKLLTEDEISLLQTSKMISSSNEQMENAGGSLQKSASTPTAVSTSGDEDGFSLSMTSESTTDLEVAMTTNGFVDNYSNFQGKTATTSKSLVDRDGKITREGSIKELLEVLELLPSSFADEVTRSLAHHFMFVYD